MNEKNLLLILGIISLISIVGFASINKQSTTGMAVPGTSAAKPMLTGAPAQNWHEVQLQDHVTNFFETDRFVFPSDKCGQIAEELFNNIDGVKTTGIEEFSAGSTEKFKTIVYKEYNQIGRITLVKGFETPETARFHSATQKMTMTIDGWKEIMELDMDLKGYSSDDKIVFTTGKIKVLDFECEFGQ